MSVLCKLQRAVGLGGASWRKPERKKKRKKRTPPRRADGRFKKKK